MKNYITKIILLIFSAFIAYIFQENFNVKVENNYKLTLLVKIFVALFSQLPIGLIIIKPHISNKFKIALLIILSPYIYCIFFALLNPLFEKSPIYFYHYYLFVAIEYLIFVLYILNNLQVKSNQNSSNLKKIKTRCIVIIIFLIIIFSAISNYQNLLSDKKQQVNKYSDKLKNIKIGLEKKIIIKTMGSESDGKYASETNSNNKSDVSNNYYIEKLYYGINYLNFSFKKQFPFIQKYYMSDYENSTNSIVFYFNEKSENAKLIKIENNL